MWSVCDRFESGRHEFNSFYVRRRVTVIAVASIGRERETPVN